MVIVAEGPDGTGKTTLCRLLAEATGLQLHPSLGPCRDAAEMRRRSRILLSEDGIWDRCDLISELVYGVVIRGGTVLPDAELWRCTELLMQRHPILFYCRLEEETLLQRLKVHMAQDKAWKGEEHRIQVVANYRKIVAAYDHVFEKLGRLSEIIRWNWLADGSVLRIVEERRHEVCTPKI